MRYWMRIHFRRVFVGQAGNVPAEGGVLLTCNHPNSFLDAMVVALSLKRPVHFLVRSDVFRKPVARYFLTRLNMIPIYRLQEGTENLDRNKDTFDKVAQLLKAGQVVLIFSEGNCVVEKRLRSLRKGTARMYFGALEQGARPSIIPVGINYTYPYQFRGELLLSFGEPLSVSDLPEIWFNEPARAIRTFNERLSLAMQAEMMCIPQPEWDEGAEVLLTVNRLAFRYPVFRARFVGKERLREEQRALKHYLDRTEAAALVSDAERLGKAWEQTGLQLGFLPENVAKWNAAFLIAGFLPALLSFFIHALPLRMISNAVKKTRKARQFKASVMFGSGALLCYLWYLVLSLVLMVFNPWLFLLLPVWPRLTWISLIWWEQLQLRRQRIQYHYLLRKEGAAFRNIIARREALELA